MRLAPGRWQVVLLVAVCRALVASAAAWWPTRLVGSVVARHPRGDAALWEPGGFWWMEVARAGIARGMPSRVVFGAAVLATVVAWSLPLACLVASRGRRAPRTWCEVWRTAWTGLGRHALLGVCTLVAQAFVLGFMATLVGFAARPFVSVADVEVPFVVGAALGAIAAMVVGILAELARCEVVATDVGLFVALARAAASYRRAYGSLTVAAAGRCVAFAAAAAVGAALVAASLPDTPVVALVTTAATSLVAVTLRASWIDRALAETERSA